MAVLRPGVASRRPEGVASVAVKRAPKERPGPPGGKRDINRKRRTQSIARAALGLFLEKGVEAVTIDDIAREADIAKGSFYRYFEDKTELVAAIFEPVTTLVRGAMTTCEAALLEANDRDSLVQAYHGLARDLIPVTQVVYGQGTILATRPNFPSHDLAGLVEVVRKSPGKFNYAHTGVGTPPYVAPELFRRYAGLELTPVPYKGTGNVLTDVIASQVDMTFSGIPSVLEFARTAQSFGSLESWLQQMASREYAMSRRNGRARQAVRFYTIAAAKGLEFDHVIVPGVSAGVFDGGQQEERNLFYVAASRARKRLTLTYEQRPSRYLEGFGRVADWGELT